MATTGVATRQGNITGGPGTPLSWSDSVLFSDAVGVITSASISTNTSVTVPSGTTMCRILPPGFTVPAPNPAYAGVLTLKGASGDTGVVISAVYPTELVWDTSPATIIINATVATTVTFVFI